MRFEINFGTRKGKTSTTNQRDGLNDCVSQACKLYDRTKPDKQRPIRGDRVKLCHYLCPSHAHQATNQAHSTALAN